MSKKRRLPPASHIGKQLIGPTVTGFTVGSWCQSSDGSGTPIAVAVSMNTQFGDIVLRLKSPQAVDLMIQALLRHKRDVWPDAP